MTLAAQKLHLMYGERVRGLHGYVAEATVMRGSRVLGFALKKGK